MAAAQKRDADVQGYHIAMSGLKLQDILFGTQGIAILCVVSPNYSRPVLPTDWRCKIFDLIHSLSHPSVHTTNKLIASSSYGMVSKSK